MLSLSTNRMYLSLLAVQPNMKAFDYTSPRITVSCFVDLKLNKIQYCVLQFYTIKQDLLILKKKKKGDYLTEVYPIPLIEMNFLNS